MNDTGLLNRAYFQALRTAAARDVPEACAQFGVTAEIAELVSLMTLEEIERLVLSELVTFRLDLDEVQIKRLIRVEDERRRHMLARMAAERSTKR